MNRTELREKIEKVEALLAGTRYEGEKRAAGEALRRLQGLLEKEKASDPQVEHKFTCLNSFSKKLMIALLRRYGLKAYRHHGQKYTTLCTTAPARFVSDVLWPEFVQLNEILTAHLDEVADRIIADHIHPSVGSEAEVFGNRAV